MGANNDKQMKMRLFIAIIVAILILIVCIAIGNKKEERLVGETQGIECLSEESQGGKNLNTLLTETKTVEELGISINELEQSIEEAQEVIKETEEIETEHRDMSSETSSAVVIKEYKKEKAVLYNIHNKLIDAYTAYEWIDGAYEIGDDDLGFDFGIKRDLYKTFICLKTLDKRQIDLFLGICAEDGKVEEAKKQLYKAIDKMTLKYDAIPGATERIQAADVVEHNGYVYLVLLGGSKIDTNVGGEEIRRQQKEMNARAIEILTNDENYENVDEKTTFDRKYMPVYDAVYDIHIPEIKSKPQNVDENEEQFNEIENNGQEVEEPSTAEEATEASREIGPGMSN